MKQMELVDMLSPEITSTMEMSLVLTITYTEKVLDVVRAIGWENIFWNSKLNYYLVKYKLELSIKLCMLIW